ncbi:MAG: ATP-dependent zinc metalloprotease FtsH [Treponema sp.]|nr:ATP-dependent zinc metalloprotease FtsH [Treponema sp.]
MGKEKKNSAEEEDKEKKDTDPYNFFKFAGSEEGGDKNRKNDKKRFPFWAVMLIVLLVLGLADFLFMGRSDNAIKYSDFRKKVQDGEIESVEIGESYLIGYGPAIIDDIEKQKGISLFQANSQQKRKVYRTTAVLMSNFIDLLDEKNVEYKFVAKSNNYIFQLLLNLLVPFGLLFLIYYLLIRKMGNGMGGGMGSLFGAGGGRSKAVEEGKVKTRFDDVAGVDEAKEELVEVVDFLKSPKKYTEIGGKIPKGVLLVGPPGTGKTLLARAVAGEAGVPFFRISGSDFVEMFVGVGASRVRDLFRSAREKAPCIVFIDELDAIGKSRMNNLGGNDEREQTLNQLLVEMDGFDNEKGLIILAATNRPDILDPALLRPGRFDRQVVVDRPDVKGREAILKIHSKNVKIDSDVDFSAIAHASSGFSGADLANIVNEAALLAVRAGRKKVAMEDFNEAIEKVMVGLQKKSRVVREDERRIVAYHETGHALAAAFTPTADPVHKITIIPRGMGALGYTMQLPEDDTFLSSEKKLLGEVDVMLGGRAAEQIIFNEISTGAANDIQRATDTVRKMITDYGMSERFKNMTLGKSGKGYGYDSPELVREYAESTQQYIDEEIARIINERYNHVLSLLQEHRDLIEYIAKRLLEIETMESKEFEEIIKGEKHCMEIAANSTEQKTDVEQIEEE